MATSCNIGRRTEKGEYEVVYCHFDGYPLSVGKILISEYNTNEDAKKLIDRDGFDKEVNSIALKLQPSIYKINDIGP